MPLIVARKRGACTACAMPIAKGELIAFERDKGARHAACAEQPVDRRYNEHQGTCDRCGRLLRKHEGHLTLAVDTPEARAWTLSCVDVARCATGVDVGKP